MDSASNLAMLRPGGAGVDEPESVTSLSGLFKALGDPLRLHILRLLKAESLSVSELCEVFDIRQSALSHHLKILVQSDLLVRRREGTAIFYRRQLPDGARAPLLDTTLRQIDDAPLERAVAAGLARVEAQREQNSVLFFQDNIARFKEQKELIASPDEYAQATLQLLARCGDLSGARILEIGPGDGSLLPELASRAAKVVALDNSQTMLESARETAGHLSNIEFVLREAEQPCKPETFHAAIANMVLHHTPKPWQLLREAAAALLPGGWLIISELCAHDQAWARENCGDLWLGVDPQQLTLWATDAGLTSEAELFIAQRNGFQIQVRLFQRRVIPK